MLFASEVKEGECFKQIKQKAVPIKGSGEPKDPGFFTDRPCPLPRAPCTLPMVQTPMSAPSGHQLLPPSDCSRAGLQMLTALPCSAVPTSGLVPAWPHPVPVPREVPDA